MRRKHVHRTFVATGGCQYKVFLDAPDIHVTHLSLHQLGATLFPRFFETARLSLSSKSLPSRKLNWEALRSIQYCKENDVYLVTSELQSSKMTDSKSLFSFTICSVYYFNILQLTVHTILNSQLWIVREESS